MISSKLSHKYVQQQEVDTPKTHIRKRTLKLLQFSYYQPSNTKKSDYTIKNDQNNA